MSLLALPRAMHYIWTTGPKKQQDSRRLKKHTLFTVSGIAVMGCIAWLGARHAERVMLDKNIDTLRQTLGPDTSLTYASANPGLLGRSVVFTGLVYRQGAETITAEQAELSRPDTRNDDTPNINHLSFHNIQLTDPAGSLQVEQLSVDGLVLPTRGDDPTAPTPLPSIGHAHASKLHGFISSLQSDITAESVVVDDFGDNVSSRLLAKAVRLGTDVAPPRRFTAASISIDGVDLAGLCRSLATGTPLTTRPGVRDVEITDVAIDGPAPLLRVGRILSHANLNDTNEQEVSSAQNVELWPEVPNLGWLPLLGYDRFRASVVLNDSHDLKTGVMHVEELSVDAPEMGRLHLHGDFLQQAAGSVLANAGPDMRVVSMTINYLDRGLAPRALKAVATAHDISPQDLLTAMRTQAQGGPGHTPSPVDKIVTFLSHPGDKPLNLTIHPAQPMPILGIVAALSTLGTAPQISQQIGLSVNTP